MSQDKEETPQTVIMDEYLKSLYFDTAQAVSFTSPKQLYEAVKKQGLYKITLRKIKDWLKSVDAYTLHKRVNRKFKRNKIVVEGIDIQWDSDLLDLSKLAKYNEGYKYVLVCIDTLSRFLFASPLKTKKPKEIVDALKDIFTKRKPKRLRTDKGGEYIAYTTQNFLKKRAWSI